MPLRPWLREILMYFNSKQFTGKTFSAVFFFYWWEVNNFPLMIKHCATVEYWLCNSSQCSLQCLCRQSTREIHSSLFIYLFILRSAHSSLRSGTDTLLKLQKRLIMSSIIGVICSRLELSWSVLNCFLPRRQWAPPGEQQFRTEPRRHESA